MRVATFQNYMSAHELRDEFDFNSYPVKREGSVRLNVIGEGVHWKHSHHNVTHHATHNYISECRKVFPLK